MEANYVIYFRPDKVDDEPVNWLSVHAGYRSLTFESPEDAVRRLMDDHGSIYVDPFSPREDFLVQRVPPEGSHDDAITLIRASFKMDGIAVEAVR